MQRWADQRGSRAVAHATTLTVANIAAVDTTKVAAVGLPCQARKLRCGRLWSARVGETTDGTQHGSSGLNERRRRAAVVSVVCGVLLVRVVGGLVGSTGLAVSCPQTLTVIDVGARAAGLPSVARHLERHGWAWCKNLSTECWAAEAQFATRSAAKHAITAARRRDATITPVVGHGTRDREGRIVRLRADGGPALVRPTLDTASPFLTRAVLTSVNETVLDTTTAWTTLIALLACLLAVDTGVLDLPALGSDTSTLERGVALVCEEIGTVTVEVTNVHHVGMAHLVGSVELTVWVHLW